jgi:hypothetical protein
LEEYLSQKYAYILDAEDIEELFANVTEAEGSIQKAVDRCNVARTTPYGWKKANYVKTITKMKILKASLETNLTETLRLLTRKSKDRTSDLLLTYMNVIYQKSFNTSREEFERILNRFLNAKQEHHGLIHDLLQDEVTLISKELAKKARELEITVPQDSIENIEPMVIMDIIPDIILDLVSKKLKPLEIANRYGVPIEIPLIIENALEPVISSSTTLSAPTAAENWLKYYQMKKQAREPAVFSVISVLDKNPLEPEQKPLVG